MHDPVVATQPLAEAAQRLRGNTEPARVAGNGVVVVPPRPDLVDGRLPDAAALGGHDDVVLDEKTAGVGRDDLGLGDPENGQDQG